MLVISSHYHVQSLQTIHFLPKKLNFPTLFTKKTSFVHFLPCTLLFHQLVRVCWLYPVITTCKPYTFHQKKNQFSLTFCWKKISPEYLGKQAISRNSLLSLGHLAVPKEQATAVPLRNKPFPLSTLDSDCQGQPVIPRLWAVPDEDKQLVFYQARAIKCIILQGLSIILYAFQYFVLWMNGMSLAGILYHYSPHTLKLSPGAAPPGQPLVFSANMSFSGIIVIIHFSQKKIYFPTLFIEIRKKKPGKQSFKIRPARASLIWLKCLPLNKVHLKFKSQMALVHFTKLFQLTSSKVPPNPIG
jgi:hypothetical protein